jgi:RNA polymerase sigma-70 factor, ECF subfamily
VTQERAPSLREIHDAHAAYVWRALRYLGVREADLPDAAQEVFLVVHRRLAEFEGRSALRTWLHGIALRVASEQRRRLRSRPEQSLPELPERSASDDPERAAARLERRARLLAVLEALPDAQREVFVLYEVEGLEMKSVAEAIGCPLQTAYTRLHAARASVRAAFDRESAP